MATMLQPFAPWMRDLSRFMNTPGAASAFLPPADLIVSDSGVTVYMGLSRHRCGQDHGEYSSCGRRSVIGPQVSMASASAALAE
jgi:hypothetical protein